MQECIKTVALQSFVLCTGQSRVLTVHCEFGFDGVGRAKVVRNDTLVFPFAAELDTAQPQDGGVLHHFAILGPQVRIVLHFGIKEQLVVLLPRKGHGGVAAAGSRADETQIGASDGRLRLRLDGDLRLWKIICE